MNGPSVHFFWEQTHFIILETLEWAGKTCLILLLLIFSMCLVFEVLLFFACHYVIDNYVVDHICIMLIKTYL